jgi:sugar lactone lactonase YvrE
MSPIRSFAVISLAAVLSVGACARRAPEPAGPSRIVATSGFRTPEAVRYDADLDVYFVSNISGVPSVKDGDGFISRLGPDGALLDTAFIKGGVNGVVLNAPKGMAIAGDTIWVTDIDALRGFDKRSGAPVAAIEFGAQGAQFLNDVAPGPDGALYITDTGIRIDSAGMSHPGPDRVFRLGGDRTITTAVQGDTLGGPNGITWDAGAGRFVIVPFGTGSIFTWAPGDSLPAVIATGPGGFDGVERLGDGRFLISSWADSSVYTLDSTTQLVRYIAGVPSPADIGVDTRRNRVAIPIFTEDRVEIWEIR